MTALQNYRGASVIFFSHSINETIPSLRALRPRYVAVVVEPERICNDFVADTYNALRLIDDDEFIDAAVGFITAATPDDMMNLINNTKKAETEPKPQKFTSVIYSNTTFMSGIGVLKRSEVYTDFFSEIGWETSVVDTYSKTSDFYQKMNSSALVTLNMHGNPLMVEGLSSSEIKAGPSQFLYPAVAIASPCFTAVTYNWTGECAGNYTINPADSFSLSFLRKGAVGYIGHLRMYGVNWAFLEPALYGIVFLNMSQGEAVTYSLNEGLLTYANPFTHAFSPDDVWLEDAKTMFFGYVLYGDPAFKPVSGNLATPIVNGNSDALDNRVNLQVSFTRNVTVNTFYNESYHPENNEWEGLINGPLTFRFALNEGFNVTEVRFLNFSDPTGKADLAFLGWMIENSRDGDYIHLYFWFSFPDVGRICNGTVINVEIVESNVIPEFPSNLFIIVLVVLPLLAGTLFFRKKLLETQN